jgi:hypothetical protein
MRRRKLLRALAIGLVALVGFGAFVVWPREERVTFENYKRIQLGMSQADVEAILGPPGDHATAPVISDTSVWEMPLYDPISQSWLSRLDCGQREPLPWRDSKKENWNSDALYVGVIFDYSGRVWDRWYFPNTRCEQTTLDNLIWRARRQWQKLYTPSDDFGPAARTPRMKNPGHG